MRARLALVLGFGLACGAHAAPAPSATALRDPRERHLADVRKLTSGGENAEAYWSWRGTRLIYQQRRGERTCDEIAVMRADGTGSHVIASDGSHTCGYFLRGDRRVIFSSTRLVGPDCPPPPDRSKGYVWPLLAGYDVFSARPDGTDVRRLTDTPGYDAESTVARDGAIVFTSVRGGDLDIYTMQPDGTGVTRLTDEPGYDGGPVFSPDGKLIAYRAWHPTDEKELEDYRGLLAQALVRPKRLDLWIMNRDGSDRHRVTDLGGASFAPAFTPDGKALIFSSNHLDPKGREFDLFLVGLDGTGLEQVTFTPEFDGFPLFSPDGRRLAFCSNRAHGAPGETNVFTARWVP